MAMTSPSKIHCAENDPGSVAYVRNATPHQRAEYDLRAGVGLPNRPFDHVMIDIETMSLHPNNALILSIGMIEFDPALIGGLGLGARLLLLPNLEQQLLLGREGSTGTQKFWNNQPREASDHWSSGEQGHMSLAGAIQGVKIFCEGKSRVWANGTQFDLSNIIGLNAQLGAMMAQSSLWHYQAPRDMRTFVKETPATRLVPIGDALDILGVPHEPIYDCISQAWQVWSHWQTP